MPHSGTAIMIEEYTPDNSPINSASEKLKILDAPNTSKAITTMTTVNTVLMERQCLANRTINNVVNLVLFRNDFYFR